MKLFFTLFFSLALLTIQAQELDLNQFMKSSQIESNLGMDLTTSNKTEFSNLNELEVNSSTFLYETQELSKRKKVGVILSSIGGAMLLAAIPMMITADSYSFSCVNNICEGDPKGGFGVVMLAAGTGMTIPGLILALKK